MKEKKITKIKQKIINSSKELNCKSINFSKGITLIALVITIVVLLILASVSIAMLTGENGILTKANEAKQHTEYKNAEEKVKLAVMGARADDGQMTIEELTREIELQGGTLTGTEFQVDVQMDGYIFIVDSNGKIALKDENATNKNQANAPQILSGMKKIMFTLPEGTNKGAVIKEGEQGFDDKNWYNYQESRWANAQTEDGSMWVWIPRYAYKITYKNPINKSEGGTIDIKFLIGTSDEYYDENGEKKTAKRATSATEEVDTTTDYYVHPAFTNESSIKYANGGWDKELTGIWVSKFEAGYASGNNSTPVKASSVDYTQTTAYVPAGEAGTSSDSTQSARNWLDGKYGETKTTIKYPTFQPKTYSMNYINMNDAYNISKALTEGGNIYGLSSSTDSHLMKNSEWGAVAYLSHSKYGTNGVEPYVNNINLNNSTQSVYAVTGVTTGTTNAGAKTTTIEKVNGTTGNTANDGIYTWDQIEGQKASTTLNMYGVYDFSGGTWERTAGYIANGNENLKEYGASVAYDGDKLKTESTKYTIVYPNGQEDNANIDNSSSTNYKTNKYIYGDGIRETSSNGVGATSWNSDRSYFFALHGPFSAYGGRAINKSDSGIFCFGRSNGGSTYYLGFHSVLIE